MPGTLFRRRRPRLAALGCCLAVALGVAASARAQPTCASATSIAVGTPVSGSSAASPGDGFTGLCAPTASAVWHWFVPSVTGPHTISLCSSSIDTVATLYASCVAPAAASSYLACDDDTCGDDAVISSSLSAGQVYYLRVASRNAGAGGAYSVLITPPPAAAPSNDFCGAPQSLPLNTTIDANCVPTPGSDVSACGTLDTSDVWFALAAGTPGQYLVQVCSRAFQPVISIHSSCAAPSSLACSAGGSAIGCDSGGSASLAYTIPAAGNILVRVAGVRGSFGSFTITAYAPRFNDLCPAAVPITLGNPATGLTTPALATEASVACGPSSFDVWHTFIAPQSGLYRFSTCAGTDFDTVLSVHSACPGSSGSTVLACNDNGCSAASSVEVSLGAGSVIWIRVAGKSGAFGNYTLASAILTPPNDLCSAAATLTEGVPFAGNSAGATGAAISSCGLDDTKDVWLAFVPPVSATYEFHTCGSAIDTVLSLFESCSGAELACSDNAPLFCGTGGAASSGSAIAAPLTAGVSYKLRLAGASDSEGPYQIFVARVAAANDQCASAMPLTLDTTVAATLTGATASISACSRPASSDVWFSFTPAVTRHYRIQTCGSVATTVLSVHSSCGAAEEIGCGLATPEICPTGGASAVALLVAGNSYRIRVADAGSAAGGAFQIRVLVAAPSNDSCASPAPLPLALPTVGANIDATNDHADNCAGGGALGHDVWFAFTPAQSGYHQFRTCAGSGTLDTILSLHTACTGSAFACSSSDASVCGPATTASVLTARLVAATTYLLRVAGAGPVEGSFTLIAAAVPPPNDTCAAAMLVGNGVNSFDTLAATTDPITIDGSCDLPFTAIQSDVWFRYTAPISGDTTVSLCGSQFDTVLVVSSALAGCSAPGGVSPAIVCNDDAACSPGSTALTPQSRLTFSAVSGSAYFIRVGTQSGVTGSGTLTISQGSTCRCDWDSSGHIEVQDIFTFLNGWFAGAGDFTGNGVLDTTDIFEFLNCWFQLLPPCRP